MEPGEFDWVYEGGEVSTFIETGRADYYAVQFELLTFLPDGELAHTELFHYHTDDLDFTPAMVIGNPDAIGNIFYYEAIGDDWVPINIGENQFEVIEPDSFLITRQQLFKQGLLKLSAGLIIDIAPILLSGGLLELAYIAENLVVDESLKYTLEAMTGRGFRVTSRVAGTLGNLFPIVSEVSSPSAIDGALDLIDGAILKGAKTDHIPYTQLPTIKVLRWVEAYLPLIIPLLRKNKQLKGNN